MKTKRYFKTMLLTMAVSGLCLQTLAGAQDTSQTQPSYSSAVKAGQAAQVAKQEAMTTNSSLQAALTHVEKAEDQMGQLQMSDDQHQKMSAEMTLNDAEDKYVGMLSKMSGVSEKDISDMHTAGVGWADVPSELGMHGMIEHKTNRSGKGSMGKNGQESMNTGSMMGSRKSEVMEATTRNTKSGMAEGHGAGMQTDVHGSGGMASGAGGLGNGNGMGSGEMGDHDNGMSGSMGGGMGGGSGSGGGHGSGGGSGSGGGGGGMH